VPARSRALHQPRSRLWRSERRSRCRWRQAVPCSTSLTLRLRGGHPEGTIMWVGSLRERDLTLEAGSRFVVPQHVCQRNHMRGGFDAFDIDFGQLVDMVEDRGKLTRQGVDLLLTQPQPGKPRHMQNLLTLNHGG